MSNTEKIRWAPKVSRTKIRQLYLTDAQGIVDEELIDEVGTALYSRCRSILLVSSVSVECPSCGQIFDKPAEAIIICRATGCTWQTTYLEYHRSWRHQDLMGMRAVSDLETYVRKYTHTNSPQEKMLLIDQLIHAFHQGIKANLPHRALANNLIEGSHEQVVVFLDALAYGDRGTPGLKEKQTEWREKIKMMKQVRRSTED